MLKRTVFLVMLAALTVPVLAAAQKLDIKGPVAIRGHGFLRGELQATDAARPVRIRFQAGFVRLVDLSGDLKVRCQGRRGGEAQSRQNAQGQTVYLCVGRASRALVAGSHYGIFAFAMQYGMLIPEGVSGTLAGRFHQCRIGDNGKPVCTRPDKPQRPAQPAQPAEPGADQGNDSADGGQSDLDQLEAALSGQ